MWKWVQSIHHFSLHHTPAAQAEWTNWRFVTRGLITKTSDPFDPRACEVIDVRAPFEFDHDHIPGSLNFPVLTNQQREQVGRTYHHDAFQARKVGAALVSGNISDHISSYFIDKPLRYRPMVYCWRGGQRSHSLALVLSQIGFEVLVLDGGYRTYRRRVVSELQCLPCQFKYIILSGLTGCGKTLLLNALQQKGAQVLDLEGWARHRGSLLGLWHQHTQPSQKHWESLLQRCLASFDPAHPVWVESESSKVGKLTIPPVLFQQMCEAERIEVCLPLEQRVKHTLRDYPHWMENVSALKSILLPLKKVYGQATVDAWFRLAEEKRWEEFVEQLLLQHYDSTYRRSQKKNNRSCKSRTIALDDLSEKSQLKFVESVLCMEKDVV
ncbi:hypothetical protein ACOMHN_003092 [Nucella lapillus]